MRKRKTKVQGEFNGEVIRTTDGKGSEAGLPEGWTRATFIVKKDLLNQIKMSAHWQRKEIKEVVMEAFVDYLNGKII